MSDMGIIFIKALIYMYSWWKRYKFANWGAHVHARIALRDQCLNEMECAALVE